MVSNFVLLQIFDITLYNLKTKNPEVFGINFCEFFQQTIELHFECEMSLDELKLTKKNLIDTLNACVQVRNVLFLSKPNCIVKILL